MRVITYRSRKLEASVLSKIDGEYVLTKRPVKEVDADDDVRMTRKEIKQQKKALKKERKKNKNVIVVGGEEINKKDFDPEEFDDFIAADALNKDGFYDMLHPIDEGEEQLYNSNVDKKTVLTIVGLAILMLSVIIAGAVWIIYF